MFLCYCLQEVFHFTVTRVGVYNVHILVTLLCDGNCIDHVHVISCEYPVCTGPAVDSASNRNEYQEHFLGVKAAGA